MKLAQYAWFPRPCSYMVHYLWHHCVTISPSNTKYITFAIRNSMALSRRPARFKRPYSTQTKAISQEQLELLRAAAARVYINEQNPADKSSEVNKPVAAGYANVNEEAGFDNGVQLPVAAATEIGTGEKMRNKVSEKNAP